MCRLADGAKSAGKPSRWIGLGAVARRDERSPPHDLSQRLDRVVRDESSADELSQRVAQTPRRQLARRLKFVEERRAVALKRGEHLSRLVAERRRFGRGEPGACGAAAHEARRRQVRRLIGCGRAAADPDELSGGDETRNDIGVVRIEAGREIVVLPALGASREAVHLSDDDWRVVARQSRRRVEVLPALHEVREASEVDRLDLLARLCELTPARLLEQAP